MDARNNINAKKLYYLFTECGQAFTHGMDHTGHMFSCLLLKDIALQRVFSSIYYITGYILVQQNLCTQTNRCYTSDVTGCYYTFLRSHMDLQ